MLIMHVFLKKKHGNFLKILINLINSIFWLIEQYLMIFIASRKGNYFAFFKKKDYLNCSNISNRHGSMIGLIGTKIEQIFSKSASLEQNKYEIKGFIWEKFKWEYMQSTIENSRIFSSIALWFNKFQVSGQWLKSELKKTGFPLVTEKTTVEIESNVDIKNLIRAGILVQIGEKGLHFSSYAMYLVCLKFLYVQSISNLLSYFYIYFNFFFTKKKNLKCFFLKENH